MGCFYHLGGTEEMTIDDFEIDNYENEFITKNDLNSFMLNTMIDYECGYVSKIMCSKDPIILSTREFLTPNDSNYSSHCKEIDKKYFDQKKSYSNDGEHSLQSYIEYESEIGGYQYFKLNGFYFLWIFKDC
jgi:hypothetical protein